MRHVWTERVVDAPAADVWRILTDLDDWPRWGPSVRSAAIEGGAPRPGARGTVTTIAGVRLAFEITAWEPPRRCAWKVAGVRATDHVVEPMGDSRCRVRIGVPWFAAPYLVVCRVGLARIGALARASTV